VGSSLVAPTQNVLSVRFNPETCERSLDALRWGLVQIWAKDPSIGDNTYSERSVFLYPRISVLSWRWPRQYPLPGMTA